MFQSFPLSPQKANKNSREPSWRATPEDLLAEDSLAAGIEKNRPNVATSGVAIRSI
jgi:hypothetical protein